MYQTLNDYLKELKAALADSDPALIQDALWDAKDQLQRKLDRMAWEAPLISSAEALQQTLSAFGTPEEAAARYREREHIVSETLRPTTSDPDPENIDKPRPWPSLFGVFLDSRAYTSLLYLLTSLATGIFYFTWAITGFSLSIGLIVLIIGLPFLVLFLGSVRALALGEGRLVELLLDVRMPRRPTLLPEGRTWIQRLGNLFKDSATWKSLVYLVLHLPFGTFYFTVIVTVLSMSLSMALSPFVSLVMHHHGLELTCYPFWGPGHPMPIYMLLLFSAIGIAGLCGTLHLAIVLGRVQGWLAKLLLVKR